MAGRRARPLRWLALAALVVAMFVTVFVQSATGAARSGGTGAIILFVWIVVVLVSLIVWFRRARALRGRREAARILEEQNRQLLARSDDLGRLLAQTPREFEDAVGMILGSVGMRLRRVGRAGDLGADLVGVDGQGRSVVVQCKRYAPGVKVGTPALQSFIGMLFTQHGADVGIYVTTSTYTQPARQLAGRYPMWLIDGDELVRLARGAQQPAQQNW